MLSDSIDLREGERILGKWRPVFISFWPCLIAGVMASIFLIPLVVVYPSRETALAYVISMALGMALCSFAKMLQRARIFFITNQRIGTKFKFIVLSEYEAPLQAITDITVTQDIPGVMFNYGTIIISTAGTTFLGITFKGIRSPYVVEQKIRDLISVSRGERR